MAYSKSVGRQWPLCALAEIDYNEMTSGAAKELIDIPPNAIITGGWYEVITAFNSGSSDAATITMNGHTYVNDTDAQAKVHTDFTMPTTTSTGLNKVTAKDTIDVTWTGAGTAASAGTIRVFVQYIIEGRQVENQT